jgi:hypothetical protein
MGTIISFKKISFMTCFILVATIVTNFFVNQTIVKNFQGEDSYYYYSDISLSNDTDFEDVDITGSNNRIAEVSKLAPVESDITMQTVPRKCFAWGDDSADKWWEMNPEYEVTIETDLEYCFTIIQNDEKAAFFRKLHAHQYNMTKCNDTYTKRMISSGWGADINHVAAGLLHGLDTDRSFQIVQDVDFWHYAALKPQYRGDDKPFCPTGDLFCYFLPIGICNATSVDTMNTRPRGALIPWAREFSTRPQQWLRHEVYEYMNQNAPSINTPCAALHVRRADVVLHGKFSRKYFPISKYIELLQEKVPDKSYTNILLFTDDQNAVDEAETLHPEYNWMYLNRTRHRGSSGGFENQIPSGSPKDEVVSILVTFRLAQKCDVLVHTTSSFATAIYNSMLETGRDIKLLQIDEDYKGRLHVNNSNTEMELKEYVKAKKSTGSTT